MKRTPAGSISLCSRRMLYNGIGRRPAGLLRGWGLLIWGLLLCLHPLLSGCREAGEPPPDIVVELEIVPQPPRIGPATVTLKLSDASGAPLNAARVRLEGNMSHAGMRPVFSEAREAGPGRYEAPIEFTMGGDWIILIHITLPDGRRLQREVEIKAIQSG
ncbi:MAG TPA: FixH family protein [Blastocatellia bacterium]|nr:FixH family protein [Blastocatellia bacterium]